MPSDELHTGIIVFVQVDMMLDQNDAFKMRLSFVQRDGPFPLRLLVRSSVFESSICGMEVSRRVCFLCQGTTMYLEGAIGRAQYPKGRLARKGHRFSERMISTSLTRETFASKLAYEDSLDARYIPTIMLPVVLRGAVLILPQVSRPSLAFPANFYTSRRRSCLP